MTRPGDRTSPPTKVLVSEVSGAGAQRALRLAQPRDAADVVDVSQRKDIPPPDSPNFAAKVREALSTYLGNRGDPMDRGVTLRDLVAAGIINLSDGYRENPASFAPIQGPGTTSTDPANTYVVDLTPPPSPTGFTASAAVASILVTHDTPGYTLGNGHARTRLYGASYVSGPLPTFSENLLLAEFTGTVYSYPVNPGQNWRLWIKWVTNDGVASTTPTGGVNGLSVTSAYDPATIIAALAGVYGGSQPYYYIDSATTINGVAVPAGTYINDLWVANGTITNAKIANLAVDDAKISSLNVSKLVAGTLAVGQFIQSVGYLPGTSGWRINANGTAEFSAASIRGLLTASQIDSRGLSIKDQFGNIILSAGNPLDYANVGGATRPQDNATVGATFDVNIGGQITPANSGTYVAPNAITDTLIGGNIKSTNYDGTVGWMLDRNGGLYATSGNFRGDISGATGTFSGTLAAGTVDFASSAGVTVTYTTPGSFTLTVPTGINRMRATLYGGGGGGGGGSSRQHFSYSGGGGASGGYVSSIVTVTPGQTFTLVVGAGGAAGSARDGVFSSGASGGAGGSTQVVGVLVAPGGSGGLVAQNSPTGGVAVTGGNPGENGAAQTTNYDPNFGDNGGYVPSGEYRGGRGGNSQLGVGGAGGTETPRSAGAPGGIAAGGGGGTQLGAYDAISFNAGVGGRGHAVIEYFDANGVVLRDIFDQLKAELRNQGLILT